MKYIKLTTIAILTLLFISSCTKKERIDLGDYESELRNSTYQDFSEELGTLWQQSYDEYGMELMCSCECEAYNSLNQLFLDFQPLGEDYSDFVFVDSECSVLNDIFGNDCNYESNDEYELFINSSINDSELFSVDEKELLIELLSESSSGINKSEYIDMWNSIEDSPTDKVLSHLIMEASFATEAFINDSDVFDDPPQAIWNHIAGAVIGAVLAVSIRLISEGVLTGEDLVTTAKYGAIGGAIRSL